MAVDYGTSKFDLTLSMVAEGDGLRGTLVYRTDLFEQGTILRMLRAFSGRIIEEIVADPGQRISGPVAAIVGSERHQLLVAWNDTRTDCPRNRCVHELFKKQVERTPEAVALVCGDQRLSYRELNGRANQLAQYLRRLGIGPDDLVAVYMERSLELVVTLLGIIRGRRGLSTDGPGLSPDRLYLVLQDWKYEVVAHPRTPLRAIARPRTRPR